MLHRAHTSGFAIPLVIMLLTPVRMLADGVRAVSVLHEQGALPRMPHRV